mgnify:CR=1 FL=1
MDKTAVDLAVKPHGVHHNTCLVSGNVAHQPHLARFAVDGHLRHVGRRGERGRRADGAAPIVAVNALFRGVVVADGADIVVIASPSVPENMPIVLVSPEYLG